MYFGLGLYENVVVVYKTATALTTIAVCVLQIVARIKQLFVQ